jgi:hypothetical protein
MGKWNRTVFLDVSWIKLFITLRIPLPLPKTTSHVRAWQASACICSEQGTSEWMASKKRLSFSPRHEMKSFHEQITRLKARKCYRVEVLLQAHGHTVLRLLRYACHSNPTELERAKVKRHVREGNASGHMR